MNVKTTSVTEAATQARRWPVSVPLICGIVLLAAAAIYATILGDPWGEGESRLPASFQLDVKQQVAIDPAQIHYQPHSQIDLPLDIVDGITIGPNDSIYVAGDRAVHVFAASGEPQRVVALSGEPSCLAVGGAEHQEPGRLYVGVAGSVETFHADGQSAGSWPIPTSLQPPVLTCIAVSENDVFVADAANRRVWRFSPEGNLLGVIGAVGSAAEATDFSVSSPYFDVVVGAEDLLHITNPGKLQVAAYTFDGAKGTAWGQASSTLDGFFGCCNPSHLAMLPDGRFVTSEKGLPRVKIYSPQGDFECVVAGPLQLDVDENAVGDPRCTDDRFIFDIAVDSQGRVLVLDANYNKVRILVKKNATTADASEGIDA